MSKAFWALGTLLELLIASRQLGKLYGAREAAEAGAFCPNDATGLLAWACQYGLHPACVYIHANCEAPEGDAQLQGLPVAPSLLPDWAIALLGPEYSDSKEPAGSAAAAAVAAAAANTSAALHKFFAEEGMVHACATQGPCSRGASAELEPAMVISQADMNAAQQAEEDGNSPGNTPESAGWQEFDLGDSSQRGCAREGDGFNRASAGDSSSSCASSCRMHGANDTDGSDVRNSGSSGGSSCSSVIAGTSRSRNSEDTGAKLGMLSDFAAPAWSAHLASDLPWRIVFKLSCVVQGVLEHSLALLAAAPSGLLSHPLPLASWWSTWTAAQPSALIVVAACMLVVVLGLAGVAIRRGRPQQQQHQQQLQQQEQRQQQQLAGSSVACATPMTAAATPCVRTRDLPVDGYDYLDLNAWQQNDQFVFGGSTVRRSGRLASKRGPTHGQAIGTPAAVGRGRARVDANEEEGVGVFCHSTGRRKAGEQEESVWVRRSRGSWLGGVQSLLRSPTSAALITPNGPGLEELQAEGGLEWSSSGFRILRLRGDPPAPFQDNDDAAAAATEPRQPVGDHPQDSAGKHAQVPALRGRTPARALREERQSVMDSSGREDGTPAEVHCLTPPAKGLTTTSRKAPRSRGQVFWA